MFIIIIEVNNYALLGWVTLSIVHTVNNNLPWLLEKYPNINYRPSDQKTQNNSLVFFFGSFFYYKHSKITLNVEFNENQVRS